MEGTEHALDRVTSSLRPYLGVTSDPIHMAIFVSLASGCMGTPISLDIASNSLTADRMVAGRILDLRRDQVRRVQTGEQLRALEPRRNGTPGLVAALVGGTKPALLRLAIERMTSLGHPDFLSPSLIRISDDLPWRPTIPGALRLTAALAERDLNDFGHAYAVGRRGSEGRSIADLLGRLPTLPTYPCHFRPQFRGRLRSDDMLLFERSLLVLAALRVHDAGSRDVRGEILTEDYHRARRLLTQLPVVPVGTSLSARAIEIAEVIFDAVQDASHQCSLPDRSVEGNKWFRRSDVVEWTGLSYTAVKKYLNELKEEEVLRSTEGVSNRARGRQIHFRFLDVRAPPFGWRNPFAELPTLETGAE